MVVVVVDVLASTLAPPPQPVVNVAAAATARAPTEAWFCSSASPHGVEVNTPIPGNITKTGVARAVSGGNIGIRVKVSAALRPNPGRQWRSEIHPRYPTRLFPLSSAACRDLICLWPMWDHK